ncbi:DEAD/DEAH box helicase [Halorubellus sp. PRR65]|uniref:DEAD/DEAH box helicase n=1 Tax=Halorubellus sp. PRR65 TaxID=3098148 RepID=UPI002B25811D|nr:DEAD/DEAH box helicase [Halorubellus sp. PRR65]
MDSVVEWLRGRPYYDGQVVYERTTPERGASFADVDVDSRVASALLGAGIEDVYGHQARAVEAVRGGEDVVLATPTASGKSLAYTIPAFERALDDRATTLYVAPQVALINDQTETLRELAGGLPFGSGVSVAQYTGQLSQTEKRDVRERQPTVLATTPDMLHYGILPHAHRLWEWFFDRLETVVIDEVHAYRGVFGSHVALVLRRLQRLCERFDADPEFVCCSATIGNPVEHAATVVGRDESGFALVDDDESATGPRRWLLWNPPEYDADDGWGEDGGRRRSPHVEAKNLFCDLVQRDLQTVVFTGSRQIAERYAQECATELRKRGETDRGERVAAYQAALRDGRREDIETRLHDGDLAGVWSTSALELGVDVGGLDAVILDGYPGTRMSTFQRAGRAGRGEDPALVCLVAGEDQLDQYVMGDPASLFDAPPERAVSNPENDQLLPAHVASAAQENWLSEADRAYFGDALDDVVGDLVRGGTLERRDTDRGTRWTYAGGGSPQHETSLRTVDDREVDLVDERSDDAFATLSFADALRDAHEGAVYYHQGEKYEVRELDLDRDVAVCSPTWADYYTRTLHEKTIEVHADLDESAPFAREDVPCRFAEVRMRKRITGFERRDAQSGETLGEVPLDLPETTLETRALYYTVPGDVQTAITAEYDFPGAIHAAEHAQIAMFPTTVLCDRRDIGGLSTPLHPHTGEPTVFVYDGHPGGVGLARTAYEDVHALSARTVEMLDACACEDGCPACVQSPHCGNANDPLDKAGATHLLDALTDRE